LAINHHPKNLRFDASRLSEKSLASSKFCLIFLKKGSISSGSVVEQYDSFGIETQTDWSQKPE